MPSNFQQRKLLEVGARQRVCVVLPECKYSTEGVFGQSDVHVHGLFLNRARILRQSSASQALANRAMALIFRSFCVAVRTDPVRYRPLHLYFSRSFAIGRLFFTPLLYRAKLRRDQFRPTLRYRTSRALRRSVRTASKFATVILKDPRFRNCPHLDRDLRVQGIAV